MLDGMEYRLMRKLPLIAVCLFLNAELGHAEMRFGGAMRGLTKISVIVEALDKDSQACGITTELIQDAFMYPVSSSNLKVEETRLGTPVFYIQVGTIHGQNGLCVSTVNLSADIYQGVKLSFVNDEQFLKIQLWDAEWNGFSQANQHNRMIKNTIEDMTKKFLTAWNLDNKPQ
jgi:hypothetical protein